jgi:DNA repair protein RadD
MILRPYQREAVEAVNHHLATRDDNPCIVLPTAAGKSLVMATLIQGWKADYPPLRVAVLAHRKELVEQNAAELEAVSDYDLGVGIFSASIGRRDVFAPVLFASIDSVFNKADVFDPFDVLLIDEAHRIPAKGEGKYRQFIAACKLRNERLRVVGLTATPYRLGAGPICHKDHILNHVCYQADVRQLIDAGYLSPIRSLQVGERQDLSGVKILSTGDYNQRQLAAVVDQQSVVRAAISDLMCHVADRRSVIVFCIGIDHCKHVKDELQRHGVYARIVTGETPVTERELLVDEFKQGRLRFLLSVNVFFEGFNARRVDCVVMLRPTASKCLWVQAVGRGMRLHPDKTDCLVLDYGGNIERHGPIDLPDGKPVKLHTCKQCKNVFSRSCGACPSCGAEIPKEQRELFERSESPPQRKPHETTASGDPLLSNTQSRWVNVQAITLHRHVKDGAPDSVRVTYHCGLQTVSEWICPDHPGFAGTKARDWLRNYAIKEKTTNEILNNAVLIQFMLRKHITKIRVEYEGRYLKVREAAA